MTLLSETAPRLKPTGSVVPTRKKETFVIHRVTTLAFLAGTSTFGSFLKPPTLMDRIHWILATANRVLSAHEIAEILYADCEDGGPVSADRIVVFIVHQLRYRRGCNIVSHSWRGYKLVPPYVALPAQNSRQRQGASH